MVDHLPSVLLTRLGRIRIQLLGEHVGDAGSVLPNHVRADPESDRRVGVL
jgi:hypothetical protein